MVTIIIQENKEPITLMTIFNGEIETTIIPPETKVIKVHTSDKITPKQAQTIVDIFMTMTDGILISWNLDTANADQG